nr:PREDICTED: mucin-2-like [Bemisia tabaci]
MGEASWILLLILVCVSTVPGLCYRMPNLTMEARYPSGFRVFIPDQRGIEEFGFNANINEPLESYEPGEISAEVKEKTGRFWIFQDDDVGLEPGDALYYWAYVVFRGVVYKRVRQKWVCINFVREFSNITLPRRPNSHPGRPPFLHPFGPFSPHPPPANFTTPPTLPAIPLSTTKRSVDTTTSPPPPPSPQPTTLPPRTAPPETQPPPTTRAPQPETTTAQPETTTAQPETTTAPPETTTAPPETTTAQPETTTAQPETTTAQPETTTAQPEITTLQSETTTTGNEVATTSLPVATPNFCNESVPTDPTEDTISTTVSDATARPFAPPVYWPSNREDCLNVWSPTYRPFMTRLKMTKTVILLECQVMSQKRKMTRVRSELFNLSKFNYEVEARLEALEKKIYGHPEAQPLQFGDTKR